MPSSRNYTSFASVLVARTISTLIALPRPSVNMSVKPAGCLRRRARPALHGRRLAAEGLSSNAKKLSARELTGGPGTHDALAFGLALPSGSRDAEMLYDRKCRCFMVAGLITAANSTCSCCFVAIPSSRAAR